jgi:hypothetical protein
MSSSVAAHDFWIQPSTFRPKMGSLVGLQLLVGQDMIGDPVPRDTTAVKEFLVVSASGQKEVPGRDGGNPAGIIRVDRASLLVVGYESYPRAIELTPEKFDQYLGEEGLDEIRSLAVASKKLTRTAHERYARCAKTLLLTSTPVAPAAGQSAGAPGRAPGDRRLGLTLELVAERNPYLTPVGQPLPFVLTYEGKPKPDALVIAVNEKDPSKKLKGRTDRAGRVTFTFPAGGGWLVKAVHMIPSKATGTDWESFWASLTFELPDSNARNLSH